MMNAKRITEIARGLTQLRGGAICALFACATLALALYSCSQPPTPPQPTPPPTIVAIAPTPAIVVPTPVSATPTTQPTTQQPPINSRPTSSHIPATPTTQPTIAPTPTPTAVPDSVPLPADAQFTQITAGKHHACGLQADGTALCWGRNISGALELPGGNLTLRRISAGLNFTCGLRIDGAIACWGENNHGQASPPVGRFDEIAVGRDNACALKDSALICWGKAFSDGAEIVQEVPPLSSIQAGYGFTCGLTPNSDMACWRNHYSELTITPGPFTDIGLGFRHACAIRVDGSVFCEGVHYSQRSQPPPTKFVQISGGWYHACGITETSDIECWGSGERGAAGQRLRAPESKFTTLAIGWRNSCALRPNGHAVCWQQPDIQNPSELPEAFGGVKFEQPTELFPLQDGRLAVVELGGTITTYSDEPNAAPPKTMLDLTDKTTRYKDESGIFSAALDPQFEKFPFLYVYYKIVSQHAYGENTPGLASRLARFRMKGGQAIRDSELTILEVTQPNKWHYGGAIRFGADRMLYLGIGDNYSEKKAQSLQSLLGKVIRIDVRGATPEQPYRIPPDNPFAANSEALPEIWAYGLRNPWRMDFAPDGRLFIADLGAERQDEVSIATAGANLGWPMCEGSLCKEGAAPDAHGLTAPIYTYGREDGCAVIGGVTSSLLNNGFVFGDYCNGRVWLLEQDEREGWRTRTLAQANRRLLSFGIDSDGTVYILTYRKPIVRLQPE